MASKRATTQNPFEPINSLVFVSIDKTSEIPSNSVLRSDVGEKAYGLCCLPKAWTLPFMVICGSFLSSYRKADVLERNNIIERWGSKISDAVKRIGIDDQAYIIIRSSAESEGLSERGKFHSINGHINKIYNILTDFADKIISDVELSSSTIPLIVQKYANPISAKGHLSNERRCYEERRDWLGEVEGSERPFSINLRNWRKTVSSENKINCNLMCNLSAYISSALRIPAAWAYGKGVRVHYEWVWDGKCIYIVQADQEYKYSGVDPNILLVSSNKIPLEFKPKLLKPISALHAQRFHKIRNVFTYIKLGLPFTKLYVLDDQRVIERLVSGSLPSGLKEDLAELVKGSLVIRMDIDSSDQEELQLLPRSDEVRDLDSAIRWLKTNATKVKGKGVFKDIVFIFHNFVPALSSAFAYSAPGERKVQIEALWGLPEGLYYNAHDKYIVDTKNSTQRNIKSIEIDKFDIQFKPAYKHYFVAPDNDGCWRTEVLKPPYDWQPSIKDKLLISRIAYESRRIADEESMPLSIMWFVGVSEDVCGGRIFPWFHELFDPSITSRAAAHRTKTPFDKSLVIRTNEDIEILRKEAGNPSSMVRKIRIQPREESLLRNKDTLHIIGTLAQKIGAVILLEGGVLSHAYYQLMQTSAVVEVSHTFGDNKENREFNKLVRDKIPYNIESVGEGVVKAKLSGDLLLRALKEKLIEESFEVLDAVDQDDIIAELADVSEVIDGILSQLKVNKRLLSHKKHAKRDKAGGFEDGVVLVKTVNPLPAKVGGDDTDNLFNNVGSVTSHVIPQSDQAKIVSRSKTVATWKDRREHQSATESILDLEVPVFLDKWKADTREIILKSNIDGSVQVKIAGERIGAKMKIDLSIYVPSEQLRLF